MGTSASSPFFLKISAQTGPSLGCTVTQALPLALRMDLPDQRLTVPSCEICSTAALLQKQLGPQLFLWRNQSRWAISLIRCQFGLGWPTQRKRKISTLVHHLHFRFFWAKTQVQRWEAPTRSGQKIRSSNPLQTPARTIQGPFPALS